MGYLLGAATDLGPRKNTNQDSYTIKIAKTDDKEIAMAVVCDGMGGLSMGEVASAFVINELSEWFNKEFADIINENSVIELIARRIKSILESANDRLLKYGSEKNVNLGSTATGVIVIDDEYIIFNIGDSRTYLVNDGLHQITEDQSLVAREVKLGKLTLEEAESDPRRNILLQCVGAVPSIEIEFYRGVIKKGEAFLLCSDGFRHKISGEEMNSFLKVDKLDSDRAINDTLKRMVDINISRAETDNITAVMIKYI